MALMNAAPAGDQPGQNPSLETYVPLPRQIEVGGKSVGIMPLRVRQIPAFVREIGPAGSLLMAGRVADAVALHGDGIAAAMAVATGEDEAWIGELFADAFLDLVAAVVEVNGDFFARRVAPRIAEMQARAEAAMATRAATPGAMSSPSSSGTATA